MAIDTFLVTPITILHPALTAGRYGDLVADWTNATTDSTNVWVDDRGGTEVLDGRDTAESSVLLYLAATVTIDALDRVEIEGQTYEVDGAPVIARTPEGPHHLEVRLRIFDAGLQS
jgi:head-tail adaptor